MLLEIDDIRADAIVGADVERNGGMAHDVIAGAEDRFDSSDASVPPFVPFVLMY